MRNRRGILCCVALLLTIISGVTVAAPLTEEQKQAFTWFDTLGFADLHGARWVRVATGRWSQAADRPPENSYLRAFLLKEEGDRFTVFTPDARIETFTRTPADTPEHKQVTYEPRDLVQDVQEYLQTLKAEQDVTKRDRIPYKLEWGTREPAAAFVIARACAANGHDDLAHDLCEIAASEPNLRHGSPPGPLLTRVSNDFAYWAIWRAHLEFDDPKVTRPQLLDTLRAFVAHFPESKYTQRAKDTATILEKMIKEDQAHRTPTPEQLAQMPVHDRVAELIFQLRDQHGRQMSQPGACDIFEDPRGDKSPAAQLLAIGHDAVPQLIDSLGDERFTRSLEYHRDFYFSHYALQVGDVAARILSRMAGRGFIMHRSGPIPAIAQADVDKARSLIQLWWNSIQEKGERQTLIDAVSSADRDAARQAYDLVQKYPDSALPALIKGVEHASPDSMRARLVGMAGYLKGDEALPFLRDQLIHGNGLQTRVAAAQVLHHRGLPEAVQAMIRECSQSAPSPDTSRQLIEFLAFSESPDAIAALRTSMGRWPVSTRILVLQTLPRAQSPLLLRYPNVRRGPATQPSAAVLDAIEQLLAEALADVEVQPSTIGMGSEQCKDPRPCDIAGYILAHTWPDRYTFNLSAPLEDRDRAINTMTATWRSRHPAQ